MTFPNVGIERKVIKIDSTIFVSLPPGPFVGGAASLWPVCVEIRELLLSFTSDPHVLSFGISWGGS